jgi:RHS repeat-associated protein
VDVERNVYLGGVERYREYSASSVNSPNGTVELERWTVQIDDIAQVDTLTVDNSATVASPVPLIRYQYRDYLGSASMETNESGQVISYEEYHPFGTSAYRTAKSGTDLSLKRYRFTNKERDDETGLYYFGVRYYAAWLGRWTSSDPGDFVDGLNMYQYAQNNPVKLVDEEGYNAEEPENRDNKKKEDDCPTGDCDDEKNPIGGNVSIRSGSVTGRSTLEGIMNGSVISFNSAEGEFFWNATDENYQSSSGVAYDESDFVYPNLGSSRFARAVSRQANIYEQSGLHVNINAYEDDGELEVVGGEDPSANKLGSRKFFHPKDYPELSTVESLTPVYGTGMQALYDFQDGFYKSGSINTVLAISDAFLVKAIFQGVARVSVSAFNGGGMKGVRSYYGVGLSAKNKPYSMSFGAVKAR